MSKNKKQNIILGIIIVVIGYFLFCGLYNHENSSSLKRLVIASTLYENDYIGINPWRVEQLSKSSLKCDNQWDTEINRIEKLIPSKYLTRSQIKCMDNMQITFTLRDIKYILLPYDKKEFMRYPDVYKCCMPIIDSIDLFYDEVYALEKIIKTYTRQKQLIEHHEQALIDCK